MKQILTLLIIFEKSGFLVNCVTVECIYERYQESAGTTEDTREERIYPHLPFVDILTLLQSEGADYTHQVAQWLQMAQTRRK